MLEFQEVRGRARSRPIRCFGRARETRELRRSLLFLFLLLLFTLALALRLIFVDVKDPD